MRDDVHIDELEVIGTTTVLEDLPRRLSPVYRRRGSEGPHYFTVDEDVAAHPILSPEAVEHLDEMVARGDAVRFDRAIPARLGYRLIQFERGALPEYIPADDLPARCFRACREALERVSRTLSEGRPDEAEGLAWYARRASHDDPLPLLSLIALLRSALPTEELHFLKKDLEEYSPRQIENARQRARERSELSALGDLIDESPHSGVRLAYLSNYPSKPSYTAKTRGYLRRRG
jgi:hypothetical protein